MTNQTSKLRPLTPIFFNNMNLLYSASEKQKNLVLDTFEFISRLFWKPDSMLAQTMWDKGFSDYFAALAELSDSLFDQAILNFNTILKNSESFENFFDDLQTSYVRLFVNAPGGIAAPLYQSCYTSDTGSLMGQSAVVMKKLLSSEDMVSADNHGEPPDHLSIELEYLLQLLQKGWQNGNSESIEKAHHFVKSNLLPWVRQFRDRLADAEQPSLYLPVTEIMNSMLDLL